MTAMLLISWERSLGGVWHFTLLSMGEEGAGLFFPTRNVSIFESKVLSLPWDPKQFSFTDSQSLEAFSLSLGGKCLVVFRWKVTDQLAKTVNLKIKMLPVYSYLGFENQCPWDSFLCFYIQSCCRFGHNSYWVRIWKQCIKSIWFILWFLCRKPEYDFMLSCFSFCLLMVWKSLLVICY